jgi:putative hemolysin
MKSIFFTSITSMIFIVLTACSAPQTQPVVAPLSTESTQANMPNPASVYCEKQGNKLEIRTAADGSQNGVCIFPDGRECDEWAYFRGECAPGQYIPTPTQPFQPTPTQPIQPTTTPQTFLRPSDVVVQTISIPAGVIVNPRRIQTGATDSFVFYSPAGLQLGEMSAPYADRPHAAGTYQGALNFPLVFHSFDTENRTQSIKVNKDGQVADLLSLSEKSMVTNLVGVPREAVILYAVFQPLDIRALQTQFFLGNVDSLATAAPILTLESPESRYWTPVAIRIKDGAPKGIWFTRQPYGIGGEIVFMYQEGLSYLDLASGTIYEALYTDANFSSLSQDQMWIAYTVRGDSGSNFFIHNLSVLGEPVLIPTLPESDRGAGDGLFSPSNQYVVWREAQGSLMDGNFHSTIRVATLDGQIVNNFVDTMFYDILQPQAVQTSKNPLPQFGEGAQISPAGWLNDKTFLVQATSPEKPHDGALVKVNVVTGEMSFFAYGNFAGWFYP